MRHLRLFVLAAYFTSASLAFACGDSSSNAVAGGGDGPSGSDSGSGEGSDASTSPVEDASTSKDADAAAVVEPPAGNQAWFKSAVIGQWAQIPNTKVPYELIDYSGVAVREEGGIIEVMSLGAGGHGGNITNNSVKSIRLDADTPAWVVRRGPSDATGWASTGATGPYFPSDNRPAPRHTYSSVFWVPELSRYVVGGRFWGSLAYDWPATDAFNPATNDWDPPNTIPTAQGSRQLSVRDPSTGRLYSTQGELVVFDPSTKTYSASKPFTGSGSTVARAGTAVDLKRKVLYHLSVGNNFTEGGTINSATIDPATAVTTAIGFAPSPGWSDFQAHTAKFLTTALTYDRNLDRFYFYNGRDEGPEKVYRVQPAAGNTWSMDLVPVTGIVPAPSTSGVQNKFFYVAALRACILMVADQDVYFLRMS
jgi:hypothetical protein